MSFQMNCLFRRMSAVGRKTACVWNAAALRDHAMKVSRFCLDPNLLPLVRHIVNVFCLFLFIYALFV